MLPILPIDSHLAQISAKLLAEEALILEAPPGTGKTTRVPAHLAFDCGQRVVVLEPRRIAARQSALRVANERGLTMGREVGCAYRFESNWSKETRLLFVTEGTFLKLIERSDFKYDVLVLDEFHERHLDSDVALALSVSRPEKILIMSATLEGIDLASYFARVGKKFDSHLVRSPLFPCEVRYLENRPEVLRKELRFKVLGQMETAFKFGGDILIFLPGVREIDECCELLQSQFPDCLVIPLHGKLSIEAQATAFKTSTRKKIIVSTNVAESSLTVPGVKVVIDSGLAREARYSAWSGLSTLVEVKISQNSAIQRQGRAAREAPGLCLRLYAEQDYLGRDKAAVAQIARANLEELRLKQSALSAPLQWFEAPPKAAWTEALSRLRQLGAIDGTSEELTDIGRQLLKIPLAPSWGRVIIEARGLNRRCRQELMRFLSSATGEALATLQKRVGYLLGPEGEREECLERLLLTGFVSSLGKLRSLPHSDLITVGGQVLKLAPALGREFSGDEWGIVFEADQAGRVHRFLSIDIDWAYELDPLPFTEKQIIEWSEVKGLVLKNTLSIGALVVDEDARSISLDKVPPALKDQAARLQLKARERELQVLKQSPLWQRLAYGFKALNIEGDLELMLGEYLASGLELESGSFFGFLESRAQAYLGAQVECVLPLQLGQLQIFYDESAPYIQNYIQMFYGLSETPKLALTESPILLKLLGPHKRALQVTTDLAGFWERGYREMLKEHRREYPRHYWPDEPAKAKPILLKRNVQE